MDKVKVTHYDTRDYIQPLDRNTLLVKVKCENNTGYSLSIVYWNKFKNEKKECKLESFSLNYHSDFFSVKLSFEETAKYLSYYFILRNQNDSLYYSPYGLSKNEPKKFFDYTDTNGHDVFTVPSWARGSVGYQIFPERFFNGDLENDPPATEKWGEVPTRTNFFGGDLRGIINKIDYIKDLGIDVIYLTPIFHSPSNHKYDTIDYFQIDPSFGTMEDLKELVKLCHSCDMKLILDGVFNHIGYYSNQFQDVIRNGKESKFWDWFYINGESIDTENINYECVGYYKWMPKLKFSTKEVREYFLSVGEYWIEVAGIDGWRLDVSDEVDFTFWQEFRKKIKSIDQNLLLIGETWKNGSDLIRGDQMDTIMNYRFRDAVIDYFAERTITTDTFATRLEKKFFDYPNVTHNILYNLLDSHDTARYLTTCKGDLNKFKLSLVFQLMFPGMPFIYYGDEIGMTGETDPDCRKTMKWDSINNEILEFYKLLINIRKQSKALKYGTFKHIRTSSEVYGFIREYENESILVFINNSAEENEFKLNLSEYFDKLAFNRSNDSDSPEDSKIFNIKVQANHYEVLSLVREGEKMRINSIAGK